jgi:hypothetical protein
MPLPLWKFYVWLEKRYRYPYTPLCLLHRLADATECALSANQWLHSIPFPDWVGSFLDGRDMRFHVQASCVERSSLQGYTRDQFR